MATQEPAAMVSESPTTSYFPRSLPPDINRGLSIIDVPLPTARLASFALQALEVDKELSPLVYRSFSVVSPVTANKSIVDGPSDDLIQWEDKTILRTEYKATTNRMLRVAVNGFMESLGTVLGVMEELDIDVVEGDVTE